jgi:hypothetical protein
MEESQNLDKKSLRFLKGKNTDWDEISKDCVSAEVGNAFGVASLYERVSPLTPFKGFDEK